MESTVKMSKEEKQYNNWVALSQLNKGDKVQLTDGSVAEFTRLKQTKFLGLINNVSYDIPVTMFVEVLEKATPKANPKEYMKLKKGDLFYIDQKGDAKLFIFEEMSNGRIIGINPISNGRTRIDCSLYADKVKNIGKEK